VLRLKVLRKNAVQKWREVSYAAFKLANKKNITEAIKILMNYGVN
jgi:hypothetical protein